MQGNVNVVPHYFLHKQKKKSIKDLIGRLHADMAPETHNSKAHWISKQKAEEKNAKAHFRCGGAALM